MLPQFRTIALAVVLLLVPVVPGLHSEGESTPFAHSANVSNLPPGCTADWIEVGDATDSIARFTDGCYHMRADLNALDSPIIDVLLIVAASPWAERDLRAMQQVIDMYEAGFAYLAEQEGMTWLAEGVEFHVSIDRWDMEDGGEFTTYPIVDPEIVVIVNNPVVTGVQGLGIDPLTIWGPLSEGPCHGLSNPFDMEAWEMVPGFNSHHDGRSGTYVEDCGGEGGNICFAINDAIDPVPGVVDDVLGMSTFDLVAHEVGHCLRLGHVGDAGDHKAVTVPYADIMAYAGQVAHKCVSTLDLETFAVAMSRYLDVNGDGVINGADQRYANDRVGDRGPMQVQRPEDHYYASSTGHAYDCPQPDLGLVPGARVEFWPSPLPPVTSTVAVAPIDPVLPGIHQISGTALHTGPYVSPPSPAAQATDASGDAATPFTDILGVDAVATDDALIVTMQMAMMVPNAALASTTYYVLTINGAAIDSFKFLPGSEPETRDYGGNGAHPEGASTWDDDAATVTFTMPRSFLESRESPILPPYYVQTITENGALTVSHGDDAAPDLRPLILDPRNDQIERIVLQIDGTPIGTAYPVDGAWSADVDLTDYAGTQTITAEWTEIDGSVIATTTQTVLVGEPNQPPTLTPIGDMSVTEGQALSFQLTADDPDGDAVLFTAEGLPEAATFADGAFAWTPAHEPSSDGNYTITFTASDGIDAVNETIEVTVLDGDADGDDVLNNVDQCPGFDDALDGDGDGLADGCDDDLDDGPLGDADGDQVVNDDDNCPAQHNPTQLDTDDDGDGDACDADDDGDGVADAQDAFPLDAAESADNDGDGVGDNADPDDDNDGYSDAIEASEGSDPIDADSKPADNDGDFEPDSTDADDDNDGVDDADDAFPFDASESVDTDGDGTGDNADLDDDGDGWSDADEARLGTDSKDAADTPPDMDGDFITDSEDPDRDGDGHDNHMDVFPDDASEWQDHDGDGTGDNGDADDDGDGYNDTVEVSEGSDPLDADSKPADNDGDFEPDSTDGDDDNDGVPDEDDAFPFDDTESIDTDGDGAGDNADLDDDGDGWSDADEARLGTDPLAATDSPPDMDGDFVTDAEDADRDGDGHDNGVDAFPDSAAEWADLDGDGTGDNADTDRDGDGHENGVDVFPNNPSEWQDLDGDGVGDNADTDDDGDGFTDAYEQSRGTDPNDAASMPGPLAIVTPKVTQGNGTVALAWDAVAGATVYDVVRAASPYALLATVSDLAFVDASVVDGKQYTYKVIARDADVGPATDIENTQGFAKVSGVAVEGMRDSDGDGVRDAVDPHPMQRIAGDDACTGRSCADSDEALDGDAGGAVVSDDRSVPGIGFAAIMILLAAAFVVRRK